MSACLIQARKGRRENLHECLCGGVDDDKADGKMLVMA